jgi:23S rRNA pseudouridine1911/1915/1917 synthase
MKEPGTIELQWLEDHPSLADALKLTLGSSGQLIKKHLSPKDQHRPLKARDTSSLPLDLVNHLRINPCFQGPAVKLIAETADYLAIHKPPGLHSHPLRYSDQDSVLNYLAEIGRWQPLRINQANYDRGLLHRLDYETSGLLLLAKNEAFHQRMRSDFNVGMKSKQYLAVVKGDFVQEGEWKHFLTPQGKKGAKQSVSCEKQGLAVSGELTVKKLQHREGHSLVLINLKTGLRHQIRAQLAFLGHPILGDQLYGGGAQSRLFLHSWRYQWEDQTVTDGEAEQFSDFFDLQKVLSSI